MTTTLAMIRRYSQRAQVWTFLGCFFLTGLGVGFSLTTIIGNEVMEQRFLAYDRQITRLNQEIDDQIALNRIDIAAVAREASASAIQSRENTKKLSDIATTLETIAAKLNRTAVTAKSAAVTAKSAADTVEAVVEVQKHLPLPEKKDPPPMRDNREINPRHVFPELIEH